VSIKGNKVSKFFYIKSSSKKELDQKKKKIKEVLSEDSFPGIEHYFIEKSDGFNIGLSVSKKTKKITWKHIQEALKGLVEIN
jgi:hypothetical protein